MALIKMTTLIAVVVALAAGVAIHHFLPNLDLSMVPYSASGVIAAPQNMHETLSTGHSK